MQKWHLFHFEISSWKPLLRRFTSRCVFESVFPSFTSCGRNAWPIIYCIITKHWAKEAQDQRVSPSKPETGKRRLKLQVKWKYFEVELKLEVKLENLSEKNEMHDMHRNPAASSSNWYRNNCCPAPTSRDWNIEFQRMLPAVTPGHRQKYLPARKIDRHATT